MKVAIIGGIGSGKSAVAKIIEELGNTVYDADVIYKEISEEESYINTIAKEFDGAVVDGKIDRQILGKMVFTDKQKLAKLNSIAHPLVKQRIEELSKDKDTVYVEVSVFLGTELENFFDKVILVEADMKLRIARIIARTGYDKDYVKRIIASQPSDDKLENVADVIIINNKDKTNRFILCTTLKMTAVLVSPPVPLFPVHEHSPNPLHDHIYHHQ